MEFATPPEVIDAIKARLDRRIFGYTKVYDPDYFETFARWARRHYGWNLRKEELVTSPGIIPALYELSAYICKPDEKILIVTPSYAYFKYAADHNHLELVTSDLSERDGHYTLEGQRRQGETLHLLQPPQSDGARVVAGGAHPIRRDLPGQ
jgi:cystathionine beta-lyase